MKRPKVMCICFTYKRIEYLARVIKCFKGQTYSNKELLIVYQDDDKTTKDLLSKINHPKILQMEVSTEKNTSINVIINNFIDLCDCDLICNWDDDDWYHKNRLSVQIDSILKSHKPVSILAYVILFDSYKKTGYLSDLAMWANTIVCFKSIYKRYGISKINKNNNDFFIKNMIDNNLIYPVIMPQLYIYIYHNSNKRNKNNFNFFFESGQRLTSESSIVIRNILEGNFSIKETSRALNSFEMLSQFCYV